MPARCWSQPGERHHKLVVVLSGSLEVGLPGMRGEELVTVLAPGEFAGEMSTLRGVAGFARIRVRESGAVLAIDEESLRDVVQTDAELSEIFMRAFILRRMGLVAAGQSDAMLLGSRHSADTLRLREFLTRNAYPFVNIDIDSDPGVQALLERFDVAVEDVPVLIGRCGRVFKNPSIQRGRRIPADEPDASSLPTVYDLLVVGAGPAGLAAAVYARLRGTERAGRRRRPPSAGRPEPARESRTISVSPPGSRARRWRAARSCRRRSSAPT